MVLNHFFLIISQLTLVVSGQEWRDPHDNPSLLVTRNSTGFLRPGEVLELSCTSQGIKHYSTLHWIVAYGSIQFYLTPRGYSPLVHRVHVTPDLHGAEFFCSAPYGEKDANSHKYTMYTVRSERIKVQVEGGTDSVTPLKRGSIMMTADPNRSVYSIGDIVRYNCTARGLETTVVDVILAKGNLEIQLNTGYLASRTYWLNLTRAEHGTLMYCIVTTLDLDRQSLYAIASNRVPITIGGH